MVKKIPDTAFDQPEMAALAEKLLWELWSVEPMVPASAVNQHGIEAAETAAVCCIQQLLGFYLQLVSFPLNISQPIWHLEGNGYFDMIQIQFYTCSMFKKPVSDSWIQMICGFNGTYRIKLVVDPRNPTDAAIVTMTTKSNIPTLRDEATQNWRLRVTIPAMQTYSKYACIYIYI